MRVIDVIFEDFQKWVTSEPRRFVRIYLDGEKAKIFVGQWFKQEYVTQYVETVHDISLRKELLRRLANAIKNQSALIRRLGLFQDTTE